MRPYHRYIFSILFAAIIISCEDSYKSDADDPSLPLSSSTYIKAPGKGQYRMKLLTGQEAAIKISVPADVTSLTITKSKNLATDESFEPVNASVSGGSEYNFVYIPAEGDVDELIGFNFTGKSSDGSTIQSDLTLVVTLSPRDNLSARKWLFTSKIWVDQDNLQDIKACEKDDHWYFNKDGSVTITYGDLTGSGGCDFDGFNVYDSWVLSEDEKTFTMVYHSLFNPSQITTDVYRVKTLTTEKLELEIDIDLSWLGLSTEETFIYTYVAERK